MKDPSLLHRLLLLGNTQYASVIGQNNGSSPTLCTNMKNEDALGFFSWEV